MISQKNSLTAALLLALAMALSPVLEAQAQAEATAFLEGSEDIPLMGDLAK